MKVKEESEKVGLKLSIQKTKIMASGPIASWKIDGETVETVSDFIFPGGRLSYVEWHWPCILDDYRDDHHCWCHTELHLCATHLVFVLSDGNYIFMRSSEVCSAAQSLYEHPCSRHMSDEVQAVCPCMPHAAHALRQPRTRNRLSQS